MSDPISRLRHPRARGFEVSYPLDMSPFTAYNDALDDVKEQLGADDVVGAVADAIYAHHKIDMEFRPLRCSCGRWDINVESWVRHQARVALAAVGGPDV